MSVASTQNLYQIIIEETITKLHFGIIQSHSFEFGNNNYSVVFVFVISDQ